MRAFTGSRRRSQAPWLRAFRPQSLPFSILHTAEVSRQSSPGLARSKESVNGVVSSGSAAALATVDGGAVERPARSPLSVGSRSREDEPGRAAGRAEPAAPPPDGGSGFGTHATAEHATRASEAVKRGTTRG